MDFIMKKESYDYMTPKEKDILDKSFRRIDEIISVIKKLKTEHSRLVRKVIRLNETAEQRMKDAENSI